MSGKNSIRFMGTAGARYVVSRQLRASAGMLLTLEGKTLYIDPGPGALVRCARSRPPVDVTKLDAIILTHTHIDHSNDVNILIDSMTFGGIEKRGALFAPAECLEGENAVVLRYLRGFVRELHTLEERKRYTFKGLSFATSMRHRHPAETYGLTFDLQGGALSLVTDTIYFPELIDCYRDSRILVVNVVRYPPVNGSGIPHLCYDDMKVMLPAIKPEMAILTHFGITMLNEKPRLVAAKLTRETGVKVIAATDGLAMEF